jgi:hypothetical protein
MMAVISISQDDVIDVEFETVTSGEKPMVALRPRFEANNSSAQVPDQLSLLRDQFSDPRKSTHPDALSPVFLLVTLICAFVVFWVSGGHVLLY